MKGKTIALDTSVLLARAAGDETSAEIVRRLVNRGNQLIAPSTVLQELAYLTLKGGKGEELVDTIIESLGVWGITAYPTKQPHMNGVAAQTAHAICEQLMAGACEVNDCLVIADASICKCDVLLTWSSAILRINSSSLAVLLMNRHLHPLFVISPSALFTQMSDIEDP